LADNKKILNQVKAVQVLDQHLKKAKLSAEQFASVIKAIELGDISDLSQLEVGLKKLSKTKFKNIEKLKQDFSLAFNKSASAELITYFNTLDTRSEQQIRLLKERNDEYGNFAKRVDLENEKILSQQKEQTEEYEEQFDILEDITKQIESLPDLQKKNLSNSLLVSDAYATQSEKLSESIQELRGLPNVFDKIKPSAEYESSLLEPIEKFTNRIKEEFGSGDYTNTRYEFQGEVNLSLADASDKVAAFVNEMQASITDKSATISATIANLFGGALDPDLVNKYIGSLSDASITLDPTEIDAIKNVISELPEEKQVELSFGISQAKVAINELQQLESVLEASTQQLDRLKTVSKPAMSTMESGVEQIVHLLASARGRIIPGWIYETLQLSKAFDKVGAAVQTSLENAASALANGASYAQTFEVFTQSLTTEFGALASQAGRFLLIVGGVVVAIGSLVALMKSVHGSAKQFSEELGVSRIQGLQLYKQTLDITNAFGNQLTTQEDVLSVLKSHQEAYGNILDLTNESNQEAVRFASSLGKQYGMAAGEVYGIQTAFQELGADQELSQGLTAYLATASDLSGISFKTITKDLAEASEFVTLHFQGMPKQAAKAAVEVRKMGMSLKQLGTVMDKTLDISGFTKDMTELNILTGGSANLSNFFDMRFKGKDPEELAKEIARQYDRMVDSGRANEFTMRKFAETTGMSVDELKKARLVREQIGNLTTAQQAALNRHLGDLDEATLKDAARAKEAATQLMTQEKFNVAMNKLKGEVMAALLPLIESFGESLSSILPVIGLIAKGFGAMFTAINFILTPVKWLFKWLGGIGEAIMTLSFDPIKDSFESTLDDIKSITKVSLEKILKIVVGMGILWKTKLLGPILKAPLTLPNIFTKAFGGLTSITGKFAGKNGLLGKLFGSANVQFDEATKRWRDMTTGKFAKAPKGGLLGKLFGGSIGKKATPTVSSTTASGGGAGPAGGMISGGGASPAGGMISGIGERLKGSIGNARDVVSSGMKSLTNAIKAGWDSLKGVLNSVLDFVVGAFTKLASGIGKVIEEILSGIGRGLNKFSSKALIGAAALLVVSAAMWVFADALQKFTGINLGTLGKAALALVGLTAALFIVGKIKGHIIKGAAALLIMSGALWVLGAAVKQFAGIDLGTLGIIGVALIGLTAAVFALGAIMMSGYGAAAIILGSIALAVMGAALIPLAYALNLVAPALEGFTSMIQAFGSVMKTVFSGVAEIISTVANSFVSIFSTLTSVSPGELLGIAGGITAISGALVAFGAGSAAGGLGSLVGKFLGGDPIKKFERLAALADPLVRFAEALERIAGIDQIQLPEISGVSKVGRQTSNNATSLPKNDLSVAEPSMKLTESQITTSSTNTQNYTNTATTSGGDKQLYNALMQVANRPVIVKIGDLELKTLNKKMKRFNNNSQ